MSGRKTRFEVIDGRVILFCEQLIWGEWLELFREDVTDKISSINDELFKQSKAVKKRTVKEK